MATRYSRRTSTGKVEYYDSKEEMDRAEETRSVRTMSIIGAAIGFCLSWYYMSLLMTTYVPEWYKGVRFGIALLAAAAGGVAAFYATIYLLAGVLLLLGLAIIYAIARAVWTSM